MIADNVRHIVSDRVQKMTYNVVRVSRVFKLRRNSRKVVKLQFLGKHTPTLPLLFCLFAVLVTVM
jgi:hypothetical protein